MQKNFKDKILVTGGAGFIGSNLVDELIARGADVVVIDNLFSGKKEYINEKAKFFNLDITSDGIEKVFESEKFDYVFHLAAQIDVRKSVADPVFDNKVNVLGGINILNACVKNNVKKIIFSSTGGAIYGDTDVIPTPEGHVEMPVSPYGIHKLTFEKYLNYYNKSNGLDYIALRFSNVYGPRQYKGGEAGVVSIFIDNAVNGKESVINGDGKQTRDYVYVADIVNALILAMENSYTGGMNIATEEERNLLEILDFIGKAMGGKVDYKHGPSVLGEQMRSCLSASRAKEILGWKPFVNLEEGIKLTINWSRDNKNGK